MPSMLQKNLPADISNETIERIMALGGFIRQCGETCCCAAPPTAMRKIKEFLANPESFEKEEEGDAEE